MKSSLNPILGRKTITIAATLISIILVPKPLVSLPIMRFVTPFIYLNKNVFCFGPTLLKFRSSRAGASSVHRLSSTINKPLWEKQDFYEQIENFRSNWRKHNATLDGSFHMEVNLKYEDLDKSSIADTKVKLSSRIFEAGLISSENAKKLAFLVAENFVNMANFYLKSGRIDKRFYGGSLIINGIIRFDSHYSSQYLERHVDPIDDLATLTLLGENTVYWIEDSINSFDGHMFMSNQGSKGVYHSWPVVEEPEPRILFLFRRYSKNCPY